MNRLEQYVRAHKNLFEEEPADGHFERLQQRATRKRVWNTYIPIAASIAFLLTSGAIWIHFAGQSRCEDTANMKICYLDKMVTLANSIEESMIDFDQWDRQQVMSDVQSILEAVNSDFEIEIPDELSPKKVKSILSNYYQQNLESLEMIKILITQP